MATRLSRLQYTFRACRDEFRARNLEFDGCNLQFATRDVSFDVCNVESHACDVEFHTDNLLSDGRTLEFHVCDVRFDERGAQYARDNAMSAAYSGMFRLGGEFCREIKLIINQHVR